MSGDDGKSVGTIPLLLSRVEAITSIRLRIFVTGGPDVAQWTVKSQRSSVAAYGSLLLPIGVDHAL
jgi:hypothetical protein